MNPSLMTNRTIETSLADELARVIGEHDTARAFVRHAGFPRQRTPAFTIPIVFWTHVVEEVGNGVPPGLLTIARLAAEWYPLNHFFARYLEHPISSPLTGAILSEADGALTQRRLSAEAFGAPEHKTIGPIDFVLVPPGMTPSGHRNSRPFYLAVHPLTAPAIRRTLGYHELARRLTHQTISRLLHELNRRNPAPGFTLPTSAQWKFVATLPPSTHHEHVLGLQNLVGRYWQMCRSTTLLPPHILYGGPITACRSVLPKLTVNSDYDTGDDWALRLALAI